MQTHEQASTYAVATNRTNVHELVFGIFYAHVKAVVTVSIVLGVVACWS